MRERERDTRRIGGLGAVARLALAALVLAAVTLVAAGGAWAYSGPRVQIWTDRGSGGLYRVGETAEISFEPSEDCYVMVYEIDTDGYLRVLFPGACDDDGYVLGGRTYRVWRDGFHKMYVNGPTGMAYVHVLASYEPFRQVYWDGCAGYQAYAREATWAGFNEYWGCALPPRVYGDPYAAMQAIDEFICLDALEAGIVWADFTYFYVGERVHYPRYLCYDCHGFDTYYRPYSDACIGFSISFVDCDAGYSPWSWWWWCSNQHAYRGPRFVCYGRWDGHDGHDGHGGHGGGGHRDDRGHDGQGTYPSEYKWKSRGEGRGLNVPAVVRRTVVKDGDAVKAADAVDAVRVKAKEPTSRETNRDLYTRKAATEARAREGRSVQKVERAQKADGAQRVEKVRTAERVRTIERVQEAVREPVVRDTEVKSRQSRSEVSKSAQAKEVSRTAVKASDKSEKVVKSEKPKKGSSLVGSIVSRVLKSSHESKSDSKPKGTSPQVRRGGEGKSQQVARRKVSR